MYIIGAFQHSLNVEITIGELESFGIRSADILALPLDVREDGGRSLHDTNQSEKSVGYVELAAILGMIGMLLGAIYGFVLTWGPILWALIGLLSGLLLGCAIRWLRNLSKRKAKRSERQPGDLFLMVHCADWQGEHVKQILWDGSALGIGVFHPETSRPAEASPPAGREQNAGTEPPGGGTGRTVSPPSGPFR